MSTNMKEKLSWRSIVSVMVSLVAAIIMTALMWEVAIQKPLV